MKSPGSVTITIRSRPWHQQEEKKTKTLRMQDEHTNAREAHRLALSSPSEVITMQNRTEKKKKQQHENKEQGKTQRETPRGKTTPQRHIKQESHQDRRLKTVASVNHLEFYLKHFHCRQIFTLGPGVILIKCKNA